MGIEELTLQQAREKLGAKQDEMGKVREQALVTGDSGEKQWDFNRVTHFGAQVKGSIAVAEKFSQLIAEANELAEHAEKLEAAELGIDQFVGDAGLEGLGDDDAGLVERQHGISFVFDASR